MRIKGGKTHRGCRQRAGAQNWSSEVHPVCKKRRRGREIVRLLRFRKHVGNIMTLVAPGVLIHWREKDPIEGMEYKPVTWEILCDAYPGRKIVLIRIHQTLRISVLAANENRGHAILENQIGVRVVLVIKRAGVFVAQAQVQRGCRRHLPAIFREGASAPVSQIHLGDSGLALLHGRQTQEHARQPRAASIIEPEFRCITVGVLVVAAILEETPHGPGVSVIIAAELQAMAPLLPGVHVS